MEWHLLTWETGYTISMMVLGQQPPFRRHTLSCPKHSLACGPPYLVAGALLQTPLIQSPLSHYLLGMVLHQRQLLTQWMTSKKQAQDPVQPLLMVGLFFWLTISNLCWRLGIIMTHLLTSTHHRDSASPFHESFSLVFVLPVSLPFSRRHTLNDRDLLV